MKKLATIAILVLLALPFTAFGQSSTQFWRLVGNKLRPIVNSYRVDSPAGFSGGSLTVSGLKNCSGLQTNANGVTSCGGAAAGGNWSGTGALQTYFDPRYVNTAGDTMTGALKVRANLSGSTLNIDNLMSCANVQTDASGRLSCNTAAYQTTTLAEDNVWVGNGTAQAKALPSCSAATDTLNYNTTTNAWSCGTDSDTTYTAAQGLTLNSTALSLTPSHSGTTIWATTALRSSGALTWEGLGSGATLYVGDDFEGAGLVSCSNATTSKLLYDSTAKRFSCGTDTDTNTAYTAGQGITLTSTSFKTNATLTGTLLKFTTATGSLARFDTLSGSLVKANVTLASSGSLVVEGTTSGAVIVASSKFSGAGLVDCDVAGTSKLLWDTTTQRFSCGTDSGQAYTAGQGLTLSSTSFRTNATLTGTLMKFTTATGSTARFQTVSGSLVQATRTLASSGGLVVEGTVSGATVYAGSLFIAKPTAKARLDVQGTISGALITQHGAGNNFFQGNVGIGKTPTTKLEVVGTISGSLIAQNGAGNNFFAGNVGIGKTATTKLEVVGTISGSIIRGTTLSGNVIRGGQFSQRQLSMEIFASGSTITTGSGKAFMTVPWSMSGYLLSRAWVSVGTGGYTGSTSVQVRNAEKGFRKLFSTPLTLDDRRFGSGQVVIDSNTREVGALDRLFFDIPTVTTTAPKSPMVILLDFYKP